MKTLSQFCIVLLAAGFMLTSCEKEEANKPNACFVVGPEVIAGVPITFNASCSEQALSYNWNFGDESSSTDANPTHTYITGGDYTVTLTVTNSEGKSDEVVQLVTVAAPSFIEHSGTISSDETWIEGTHILLTEPFLPLSLVPSSSLIPA